MERNTLAFHGGVFEMCTKQGAFEIGDSVMESQIFSYEQFGSNVGPSTSSSMGQYIPGIMRHVYLRGKYLSSIIADSKLRRSNCIPYVTVRVRGFLAGYIR